MARGRGLRGLCWDLRRDWPIEQRHGAPVAILISSFFFMALHRLASEDGYAELPPPLLAKIKTKVSSLH